MTRYPRCAPRVAVEQEVRRFGRPHDLWRACVDYRAGQSCDHRHRQEGSTDGSAIRHPEGDVRGAESHVQPELFSYERDGIESAADKHGVGADRHRERIDDDVLQRDLVLAVCHGHDLADELEPALGLLGNLLLVVGQADDRRPVTLHERQDRVHPLVFGGDRVDERFSLICPKPGFEHLDDRRVDHEGKIGETLDETDGLPHQLCLVGKGYAHVHVQDHRARGHLVGDISRDPGKIVGAKLLLEKLAPRRVDSFADYAERLVFADYHLLRGRAENGVHALPVFLVDRGRYRRTLELRPGRQGGASSRAPSRG